MSEIRSADARYTGQSGPIFGLSLKVAFLTLLTLGIYRFWGKSRIRRYIWSSAELDGDRFEYTGTGLEKFLGFLMAVVFLAVYLGIVQISLTFFGFSLLGEPQTDAQMVAQALAFFQQLEGDVEAIAGGGAQDAAVGFVPLQDNVIEVLAV